MKRKNKHISSLIPCPSCLKDMLFAVTLAQKWEIIETLCDVLDLYGNEEHDAAFTKIWDLLVALPVLEPVEE